MHAPSLKKNSLDLLYLKIMANTDSLYSWLYLDLNSFFATVEQQYDPKLRGKPVAVVPVLADSSCVIAASTEAKRFGIKTNTRISDAKRMCPNIIFKHGNHERYAEAHHKIVTAVENVLPIAAVCSIDEMAFQLMGSERSASKATLLAKELKARIRSDAGDYLSCSIGIAPNRFLAKVASDRQKPDGLILIAPQDLPHCLHDLELRDFPGIGANMEKRIRRYGIHSVKRLCELAKEDMRLIWGGINGERFFQALHGEDYEEVETETRSIGHSHVLPPEYRNIDKALLVAQKLLHKASARLRKAQYWTSEMQLSVSFLYDDDGYSAKARIIECCDDLTLLETLKDLWNPIPRWKRPMKVSITLNRLVTDSMHTLSLFENPRRRNLSLALDSINQKFGKNTVSFASLQGLQNAAPTRIAFTSIPDFSV